MLRNELLSTDGHDLVTCPPSQLKKNICKAFTSGYFYQLGKKSESGFSYEKVSSTGEWKKIFLHPTSALYQMNPLPEWIIFQEITESSKILAAIVTATKPKWIMDYAPEFWKKIQKKFNKSN